MSSLSRRRVLASGAVLASGLAGCMGVAAPDQCEPAEFPEDGQREEPPTACQYGAELETKGMDVDSTMDAPGGGASVMYFRDPDIHDEQIRTVAMTFVRYRRMVDEGKPMSFTALTANDDRHGNGYVAREWADETAEGRMDEKEYLTRVRGTYDTL